MSNYPTSPPLQSRFVQVRIDDVSTAQSAWVVPGFRGRIRKASSVIDGALATSDAAITFEIGGTAVSGLSLTLAQSGSAAGDVDQDEVGPLEGTATFDEDQAIEVITDGASTNTVAAVFTLEVEPI